MPKSLFITGTDTNVGKTYITCQLLRQYRHAAGINAVGMKPVTSGMQKINGRWINEDIEQIYQASDRVVSRKLINQYAFPPFSAPHQAAAEAGKSISLQKIKDSHAQLEKCTEQVIVEGAGGLMTPLNNEETFVDLAQQLEMDIVLVIAIRLGCINHALLTKQVIQANKIHFAGWVANYPQAGQDRDQTIEKSLQSRLNAPLLGIMPWEPSCETKTNLDLSHLI